MNSYEKKLRIYPYAALAITGATLLICSLTTSIAATVAVGAIGACGLIGIMVDTFVGLHHYRNPDKTKKIRGRRTNRSISMDRTGREVNRVMEEDYIDLHSDREESKTSNEMAEYLADKYNVDVDTVKNILNVKESVTKNKDKDDGNIGR